MIDGAQERYKTGVGSATPSPSHLYDVRDPDKEGVVKLSEKVKEEYHSLTAQCLYISKRARPDLQTSIAFHCTRVISPDENENLKLARTIGHTAPASDPQS